eukprot:SAG11_NODE_129_length_15500_cov_16.145250_11_plen_100_part_00
MPTPTGRPDLASSRRGSCAVRAAGPSHIFGFNPAARISLRGYPGGTWGRSARARRFDSCRRYRWRKGGVGGCMVKNGWGDARGKTQIFVAGASLEVPAL